MTEKWGYRPEGGDFLQHCPRSLSLCNLKWTVAQIYEWLPVFHRLEYFRLAHGALSGRPPTHFPLTVRALGPALSVPRSPNKFNKSTNGEPNFYTGSSHLQTSQRQNTRPTSSVPQLQKGTGKACKYVERANVSITDSLTNEGLLTGEAHFCLQIHCYQARWCPSMQLAPVILRSAIIETQWHDLTGC